MRLLLAAIVAGAVSGCAPQRAVELPVDHAGFLERWRRVCELGKASAAAGTCAVVDAGSEDESDEIEASDEEGDDRDAPDDPTRARAPY